MATVALKSHCCLSTWQQSASAGWSVEEYSCELETGLYFYVSTCAKRTCKCVGECVCVVWTVVESHILDTCVNMIVVLCKCENTAELRAYTEVPCPQEVG